MIEEMKKWIDDASYQELLEKWRFEPIGSQWFKGETGKYFKAAMETKRENTSPEEQVAASKAIGYTETA